MGILPGELTVKQGTPAKGGRVIVAGHDNLALIRPGEDWSLTEGEECRTWFEDIEPVLHEGTNRSATIIGPRAATCNRYLHHMDENGNPLEKGFGYSLWRSTSKLEHGESHHTHLEIFVTFNRLAKKSRTSHASRGLGVDASNQYFEYINRHRKTGASCGCLKATILRRPHIN